jgi:quercetin dioxygenase-like cupin family protein
MKWSVLRRGEAEVKRVEGDWGTLIWLAGKGTGNAAGISMARVTIRRGFSNPPHAHPNCEEVLHLLSGRLNHFTGGEWVTLEPGDTLSVAPEVVHYALSIGETDADMLVAYSTGERGFVPVPVPDP